MASGQSIKIHRTLECLAGFARNHYQLLKFVRGANRFRTKYRGAINVHGHSVDSV